MRIASRVFCSLGAGALLLWSGCGDDGSSDGSEPSTGMENSTSTTGAGLDSTDGGSSPSGSLLESSSSSFGAGATETTGSAGESSEVSSGGTAGVTPDVRVLFLGNSYTQFNGMTDMVAALAADAGSEFEVVAITQGGATVADLLARRDVQTTVAEPDWDFVVIQGQSYEPLLQPLVFEDAAVELAGLVSVAGAEPVFFETWARVAGHELYDQPWSGGDPAGMQALLHAAYGAASDASGGTLAPAGQGWALCVDGSPEIVLHSGDGSHPSVAGSYLAAAVFYAVMSEGPVEGNGWWPDALAAMDAETLQGCADAAVLAVAQN